jgi:hypothetical protein
LPQIDPTTVGKNAEDVVFAAVIATGGRCGWRRFLVVLGGVCVPNKSVSQARVVTGIKIYSCYLQNLEEK